MCTFGLAIKIKDPGPVFFSQTRIGQNGKKFKIYKFRSMYMDAEDRKKKLLKQNTYGETDINNNRRDGFANSDYGSEDSWNDYISLAKTSLVDLISSQYFRV